MKNRIAKRLKYARLLQYISVRYRLTPEERVWLDVSPVGREFGSSDYERLATTDPMQAGPNERSHAPPAWKEP